MIILNDIWKRFKYKPVITFMFIFITCISMLFISIGTSTAVELKNQITEKNSGYPTNYSNINIGASSFNNIEKFINIIKGLEDSNFIQISLGNIEMSKDDYFNIYAQYFNKNCVIEYPYLYGGDIELSDIHNNKKVVCIGKNLEKYTFKKNGEIYLKYNNEEYLVSGIIGNEGSDSLYDNDIIFPITSIPNSIKVKFFDGGNQKIGLWGENTTVNLNYIYDQLSEIDNSITFTYENINEEKVLYESIVSSFSMVSIFIVLLGICICNMTIISYYWSKSEEREIAIKKAYGFSKIQLAKEIFCGFFTLVFISASISILIQFILSLNTKAMNNLYIFVSKENIIISIIICIVISIVISILPIINAINVSPKITLGKE